MKDKKSFWSEFGPRIAWKFLAATGTFMAVVAVVFPFSIVLHVVEDHVDPARSAPWYFVGLMALLPTVFGLFPADVYLRKVRCLTKQNSFRSLRSAFVGCIIVWLVVVFLVCQFVSVPRAIFLRTGIYSNEKQKFLVLQPSLVSALRDERVSVAKEGDSYFAVGYVQYQLGGVRILCNQPADRGVNAGRSANEKSVLKNVAGLGCVQTLSNDLRLLF